MPQLKLTKTNIDRVAKPGSKSDVLYWDTDAKGFGLRVTPTGKATFIAQGRVRGTAADVRLTIGTYGAWTVDDARRRANEHRHSFEDGIDPRDLKKQNEAMKVTLGDVCTSYISRPGKLKAVTAEEYKRHIEKVFAVWRDKPIAAITRHAAMIEIGIVTAGISVARTLPRNM